MLFARTAAKLALLSEESVAGACRSVLGPKHVVCHCFDTLSPAELATEKIDQASPLFVTLPQVVSACDLCRFRMHNLQVEVQICLFKFTLLSELSCLPRHRLAWLLLIEKIVVLTS